MYALAHAERVKELLIRRQNVHAGSYTYIYASECVYLYYMLVCTICTHTSRGKGGCVPIGTSHYDDDDDDDEGK